MLCNTGKCKELVVRKKGDYTVYPTLYNIKQHSSIPVLGIVLQNNCKFSQDLKNKLYVRHQRIAKITQQQHIFFF